MVLHPPGSCCPKGLATPVNAVVGDVGFRRAYGRQPTPNDADEDRIRAHLRFITSQLQVVDHPDFHEDAIERRKTLISALKRYAECGQLLRNVEHPEVRTPIFIDSEGRCCAVAHLICTSGHKSLAVSVDTYFHMSQVVQVGKAAAAGPGRIDNQNAKLVACALLNWANEHGFTLDELAEIQPGYTPRDACAFGTFAIGSLITLLIGSCTSLALAFWALWDSSDELSKPSAPNWLRAAFVANIAWPILGCLVLSSVDRSWGWIGFIFLGLFATLVVSNTIAVLWALQFDVLPDWVNIVGRLSLIVPVAIAIIGFVVGGGCICLSNEPMVINPEMEEGEESALEEERKMKSREVETDESASEASASEFVRC